MHIGYPYQDEYIALAKHYRNAYVDMCWAWIINPGAAVRFLKEFLVAAPANKLFTFGGDYIAVENVLSATAWSRAGASCRRSPSWSPKVGWIRDDVPPSVERMMHGNAHELFGAAARLSGGVGRDPLWRQLRRRGQLNPRGLLPSMRHLGTSGEPASGGEARRGRHQLRPHAHGRPAAAGGRAPRRRDRRHLRPRPGPHGRGDRHLRAFPRTASSPISRPASRRRRRPRHRLLGDRRARRARSRRSRRTAST